MRTLIDTNREALLRVILERTDGSVTQAAKQLGVSRATVYRWMRRYGIVLERIVNG